MYVPRTTAAPPPTTRVTGTLAAVPVPRTEGESFLSLTRTTRDAETVTSLPAVPAPAPTNSVRGRDHTIIITSVVFGVVFGLVLLTWGVFRLRDYLAESRAAAESRRLGAELDAAAAARRRAIASTDWLVGGPSRDPYGGGYRGYSSESISPLRLRAADLTWSPDMDLDVDIEAEAEAQSLLRTRSVSFAEPRQPRGPPSPQSAIRDPERSPVPLPPRPSYDASPPLSPHRWAPRSPPLTARVVDIPLSPTRYS